MKKVLECGDSEAGRGRWHEHTHGRSTTGTSQQWRRRRKRHRQQQPLPLRTVPSPLSGNFSLVTEKLLSSVTPARPGPPSASAVPTFRAATSTSSVSAVVIQTVGLAAAAVATMAWPSHSAPFPRRWSVPHRGVVGSSGGWRRLPPATAATAVRAAPSKARPAVSVADKRQRIQSACLIAVKSKNERWMIFFDARRNRFQVPVQRYELCTEESSASMRSPLAARDERVATVASGSRCASARCYDTIARERAVRREREGGHVVGK